MVAGAGFEPATSRLWAWRAANCSIPRYYAKASYRKLLLKIFFRKLFSFCANYINLFLKNAFPEPVFKYCSKLAANFLFLKIPIQYIFIGNLYFV